MDQKKDLTLPNFDEEYALTKSKWKKNIVDVKEEKKTVPTKVIQHGLSGKFNSRHNFKH